MNASRSARSSCALADGVAKVWSVKEGKLLGPLNGHTDRVTAVAFSADGAQMATGSGDTTARVWDPKGKQLAVMSGHTDSVIAALHKVRRTAPAVQPQHHGVAGQVHQLLRREDPVAAHRRAMQGQAGAVGFGEGQIGRAHV